MANSDTSSQAGTTTNTHVVVCNDGYTSPPLSQTWIGHADSGAVAVSPDGNTVASGSFDTTIKLWDESTGALLQTWTGHADWVNSVAFSPDGNTVVSGSSDNTIKLWDDGVAFIASCDGTAPGVSAWSNVQSCDGIADCCLVKHVIVITCCVLQRWPVPR